MYYYRGKLRRQNQWAFIFGEKPEQGIWYHGMMEVVYYRSHCGEELAGFLDIHYVIGKTYTRDKGRDVCPVPGYDRYS